MGDYNNPNENNNGQQPNNPNMQQNQQPQDQQPQNQQPQYQQPLYQQPDPNQNLYQNQNQYNQNQYQQYDPNLNQYQQPYQQYQQPIQQKKSNGMAIGSMVCGIVSFVLCCCWYIAIPLSIASIVLAIIVLKGKKEGKGMAIAGIVLSSIALILAIIIGITALYMASSPDFLNNFYEELGVDLDAY